MLLKNYLLIPISALLLMLAGCAHSTQNDPRVIVQTSAGDITIELYPDKAPITVANFIRYIEVDAYDGACFYRTTRPDNDPLISVLQGGLWKPWQPGMIKNYKPPFPSIEHETTQKSGLSHLDGTVSMGRLKPGSANSEFFISVGDNPALDFGGERIADGQGFAAFGRVIKGMDVVRRIHTSPTPNVKGFMGQILVEPVAIEDIRYLAK